jgi:hypothetical protein
MTRKACEHARLGDHTKASVMPLMRAAGNWVVFASATTALTSTSGAGLGRRQSWRSGLS